MQRKNYNSSIMRTSLVCCLISVVWMCILTGTRSHFHVEPANVAVRKGSTLTFRCAPENLTKLSWSFGLVKLTTSSRVRPDYANKTVLNKTGARQFDLIVKDVELSDAGLYSCSEINTVLEAVHAELIVFESALSCHESTREVIPVFGVINITCTSIFSGRWTPRIHCRHIDVDGRVLSTRLNEGKQIHQTLINSTSLVYQSTMQVDSTMNNTKFQCLVYFNLSDYTSTVDGSATNVPDFDATWESHIINVVYSLDNENKKATISTAKPKIEHSTTIMYVCGSVLVGCVIFTMVFVLHAVRKMIWIPGSNHALASSGVPDLVMSNSVELLTGSSEHEDDDQYDDAVGLRVIAGQRVNSLQDVDGADNQGAQLPSDHNDDNIPQLPPGVPENAASDLDGGVYAELAVRAAHVDPDHCNSSSQMMVVYATVNRTAANTLSQAIRIDHEDSEQSEQSDVVHFVEI